MNTMHDLLQFGFQNALAATVLAVGVCLLTRYWRNPLLGRTLWLLVLIKLVTPPLWQMPLPLPTDSVRTPVAAIESSTTTAPLTPTSATGWIDDGVSRGPAGVLTTPSALTRDLPQPQPTMPQPTTVGPSAETRPALARQANTNSPSSMEAVEHSTNSRLAVTLIKLTVGLHSASARSLTHRAATWDSSPGPPRTRGASNGEQRPGITLAHIAVGVWLSGTLVMLLLIARRTWRFARHLRRCPRPTAEERAAIEVLARQIGLARPPDVRSSAATHPPLVWCLGLRPLLVLPRALMQQLSADERTTVLAHELAHIRRGDHYVRLLEAAVITLFWWHPVVWWARRELQRCEEQCCDADVLRLCPDCCETYVGVLVKTVEFLQTHRPLAVAFTSAMAQKHSLIERIERILGDDRPARWSWASRLTTLALVALLPLSVGWGAGAQQEKPTNPAPPTATDDQAGPPDEPTEDPGTEPIDPPAASAAAAETNAEPAPGVTSPRATDPLPDAARVQFEFVTPEGLHIYQGRDPLGQVENSDDGQFHEEPDEEPLTTPGRINLLPGAIYQLKFAAIPGHAGLTLFPTLEVAAPDPMHAEFLQHNSVPIKLTDEDVNQVAAGNFVTKVIYLPDHEHQQLALVGFEVLVSTRLDPDVDPVAEADRRGTIVAVLRLGNRSKAPVAGQQELVPFDRPYGELGYSDGEYGPHYETVRLATHAPVQNELGLSASQRRRLAPVSTSLMHKSDRWPRSGDHPDLLKEEYDRTLSILAAAQKQRLDEIIFRRLGYAAFLQPQYAEQIGLTPQQSEQFRQAWQKHAQRGEKGWKGDEGRQAYHKLQAETLAALTPQQRERYAELIGDPVETEMVEPRVFYIHIEKILVRDRKDGTLYPVPVRDDGTLLLPLIPPVPVEGLSADQVKEKIRAAYLKAELLSANDRIVVSTVQLKPGEQPPQQPAPSRLMPEFVNEVLYWLPTDTETLIVSRDFQARSIHDDANLQKSLAEPQPFRMVTRSLAAAPVFDLPPAVKELLADRQIEWAILGGRNYEFTSAFGGYRFDGCTVLRFAEPILKSGGREYDSYESPGEPHPVVAAIQKAAKEQWLISQSQVHVFPVNSKQRESWVKPRTGEGLYLALHDDHTMILATSDVYLLQTLRRMEGESLDRAMPATMPEWEPIDLGAGTWGIRRVPENSAIAQPTTVETVVWMSQRSDQPDETFAVYYRGRGKADLLGAVQQLWVRSPSPQTRAILDVKGYGDGKYCSVKFNKSATIGDLLEALVFSIRGLPATSF